MKKLGLFDFNGTLVNDNEIWLASMEEVFIHFEKKPPTAPEFFADLEKLGDYAAIYKSRGIDAHPEEISVVYKTFFLKRIHLTALYPGVLYTLNILKERGYQMGLITAQ